MDIAQLSFDEKMYWISKYRDDSIKSIEMSNLDVKLKQYEINEARTYYNNAISKLDHMKHDRAYWSGIYGCIKSQMKKEGKYNMELQTFNNEQFGVLRTAEIEGKIYYCGSDVAQALGYTNPRDAISRHCRCVVKHDVPHPQNPAKKIEMSFLPEGDVYRLTAHSKLPQAEKFESWVFDEVLPQIAHTGAYTKPKSPMELLELQYQALKEVNEKTIQNREEIKEVSEKTDKNSQEIERLGKNARLDPGQYTRIGQLVSARINEIKQTRKLSLNKKQNGLLFQGLNHEIKQITGVGTRTDLRQKHYVKVCDFIHSWEPSSATMEKIKELEDRQDETIG